MIAVLGSANIDLITTVPALPAPGETVLATEFRRLPGGKGANQAVAAARAGSDVMFVGAVGADDAGDELLAGLGSAGVDTSLVRRDTDSPTGTALISVDRRGENTIVVVPGANAGLRPADVDAAAQAIARSSFLVLQLEVPLETVVHAIHLARSAGVRVLLNPAPATALPPDILHQVDFLVPNVGELAFLTGMGAPVDPATAAGLLVSSGCRQVIVTMGAAGALVATDQGTEEVPAPAVTVVDTTGAGDAFVGNLAVALDGGRELQPAVRFAVAAAALSVTRQGAQAGMPLREQTERTLGDAAG